MKPVITIIFFLAVTITILNITIKSDKYGDARVANMNAMYNRMYKAWYFMGRASAFYELKMKDKFKISIDSSERWANMSDSTRADNLK